MIDPFQTPDTYCAAKKRATRRRKPSMSNAERRRHFKRDFWVDYPLASELLERLEESYATYRAVRPEGMTIIGCPSGEGG